VAELAERVIALTGSRSPITRLSLPADDPIQRCPDIAHAQALLGWEPRTDLQDGLARTIAYFDALLSVRKPVHAPSARAAMPASAAVAAEN
jgi:UDP-glucuronate decarboxylase